MDRVASSSQGGWGEARSKCAKNITLPKKTKCKVCQREKVVEQYSNKQLNDLRNAISRFGQAKAVPKEGLLRCKDCTGTQNVEMKCTKCMVVRSLDKFALAQRSKKDDAICMACMEYLELWAVDNRQYGTRDEHASSSRGKARVEGRSENIYLWSKETGDYHTNDTNSSAYSDVGGVPLPSTTGPAFTGSFDDYVSSAASTVSGSTTTKTNRRDSESFKSSSVVGSSAWIDEQERAGSLTVANLAKLNINQSESAGSTTHQGRSFRGYDPNGYMHIQRRQLSSASDASESEGDETELSEPSASRPDTSKWAKVRPLNKPVRRYKRPEHEDEIFGKPNLAPISIDVMENYSSDEDD